MGTRSATTTTIMTTISKGEKADPPLGLEAWVGRAVGYDHMLPAGCDGCGAGVAAEEVVGAAVAGGGVPIVTVKVALTVFPEPSVAVTGYDPKLTFVGIWICVAMSPTSQLDSSDPSCVVKIEIAT